MAITYSWKVVSLNRGNYQNLQNVVTRVDWMCTGIDEDNIVGLFSGETDFDPVEIQSNNFVEYNQLTEQIVLGWIENKINADIPFKNYIEECITLSINHSKTMVPETNFPWNQ